ncbi:MAG: hypothetical protein A3H35_17035 [Betaproteobacteria bacterium RIFCSPLOWO2_02_FULL_62_17]|nr:MAG: hypothetical protein A3H35_17035 [Betaproteobacteria bacterium RIFCSPLOWO2_02_FULL_62_17]
MRLLVLILLLVNVAFYAWVEYVPESSSAEGQLMAQQINPESIRLLSASRLAAARKPEAPKTVSCIEWSGFGRDDAARAQEAVLALSPGMQITERKLEETTGWWVFMPPQASRQGAVQKVEELKRLGIDEYFIVQEDAKFRFAISLGIFRSEEAAQKKLEQLQGRGVRTARVGPRTTPVNRLSLQLRDVQEGAQPKVVELVKEFPGTTFRDCAA